MLRDVSYEGLKDIMRFGGVRGKNVFVFPDHEAGPLGRTASEPHNALKTALVI